MKRFILLTLCFSYMLSAEAQTIKLTLEEAINYALRHNFAQQSMLLDKRIEENTLEQSKLELLPDLNAGLTQNFSNSESAKNNWNGNYNLSASVMLYQGGKNMNAIKLNKLFVSQSDTKISQAQNDLATQVIQAFLEVIMNEELYGYLQLVAKTSTQQMKEGAIKCENGQILKSDYLLLKAQAATDRYNVVNTKTSRDNSLLKLKTLLSMDEKQTPEVVAPTYDQLTELNVPSLAELIERTFEWFPDLEIARQNITISELNIKQARTSGIPSLSLGGSLASGYNSGAGGYTKQLDNRFNQQAGVTLSIPIWNKGRTKSQVRQASFQLKQSKLQQSSTQLELRQQLEQEYNSVTSGYLKYQTSAERSEAYRQSAEAYRKQYEQGEITVVEMLQQETNYLSALNDYIQNKYSYMLNRKILDVYMGVKITL